MAGVRMAFAGEVAVITGGSGGIGSACARLIAAQGGKVYLLGRSQQKLERVVEEIKEAGGTATALTVDVSSEEEVAEAAQAIGVAEGRIDLLVNSAGSMTLGRSAQMEPKLFEEMMRVNYMGVVFAVHAFLPWLRQGERRMIVNISSLAGKIAPPYFAAYAASKFAVNGYSYSLRQELAPEGIKVMLVEPGPTQTAFIEGYIWGEYYPLPPGVPIIGPGKVAQAVVKGVLKRRQEVVVPGRLAPLVRLAGALPSLVDLTYRLVNRQSHRS